jgi:sialic acid synthase SpsE
MPGPDQPTSLEPLEMRELVVTLRATERALGTGRKEPAPSEARNMEGMRRGIVARRDIKKGHVVTASDLILKRPLSGIPPSAWDKVVGTVAVRAVKAGNALTWADLEDRR